MYKYLSNAFLNKSDDYLYLCIRKPVFGSHYTFEWAGGDIVYSNNWY